MSPRPTRWVLGSDLPARTQRECLARYVYRFTADHRPAWATALRPNGQAYQVQFASDADWLAHKRGTLRRLRVPEADAENDLRSLWSGMARRAGMWPEIQSTPNARLLSEGSSLRVDHFVVPGLADPLANPPRGAQDL